RQPVSIPFDDLQADGEAVRVLSRKDRKALRDNIVRRDGLERTEAFIGEGRALFRAVCRLDLEAVIAKRREDPYGPIVRVRQCGSIPMAASSHGDVREQVRQSQSSRLTEQVCAAVVRNNPPWPDRQDRGPGKAARIATSSPLTL